MFNMAKILKCDDCGSIIQVLAEDDGDACDTHMFEFPAQTEGEKSPKHKPVVEIDGNTVLEPIEDEAEFDDISAVFCERLSELFDFNSDE